MKIQDVMTKNLAVVTPDAPATRAAQIMREQDVGVVPVVDGSDSRRLIGVVTDRDLAVRLIADGRNGDARVREVMSERVHTCRPDEELDAAMDTMAREQVRRIPIVDERGMLVGIVAQADLVRKARNESKVEDTVEQISQPRA